MKDPDGHTPRILVVEDDQVMSVDYLSDHNMRGLLSGATSDQPSGMSAQKVDTAVGQGAAPSTPNARTVRW
jgi:hypothetical protein